MLWFLYYMFYGLVAVNYSNNLSWDKCSKTPVLYVLQTREELRNALEGEDLSSIYIIILLLLLLYVLQTREELRNALEGEDLSSIYIIILLLLYVLQTREELRNALEDEIRAFNVDKDLSSNCEISWNHQEFEVQYSSISEEIKIGDYYLRLLLEEEDNEEYSAIKKS